MPRDLRRGPLLTEPRGELWGCLPGSQAPEKLPLLDACDKLVKMYAPDHRKHWSEQDRICET
jgi:hypothetical protein